MSDFEIEQVKQYLSEFTSKNDKLALFLDYDGTLAPISPRPELAVLPERKRKILQNLANCPNIFLGIISGRQADNAKSMVKIDTMIYAGSHGFEIIYPDRPRYTHKVPAEEKEKLTNVENALKKEVARDGAWVENKGDALTFHFRETPKEKRESMIQHAKNTIRSFDLVPSDALCAIEVQPSVKWHKGYAADFIMKTQFGPSWNKSVKFIFAGDDVSDEKLIEMFQGVSNAATFRVAESPVKTAASMQLHSIELVTTLLEWLEKEYCN